MPAVFLANYVFYVWLLFLVPHAEGLGIDPSRAVLLSSIAGIAGTVGSIVFLVLLHFNYDTTIIIIFCCLVSAISFFLDTLSSTFVFLAVMAGVQGLALFVVRTISSVMAKLAVRDAQNIPSALSLFFFLEAVGVGAGDTISGHIYDVTSSMHTVFISFGIALVVATANLIIFAILVCYKASVKSDS
ncbi:uncharacterized protein LOC588727 [Strongylocentrotus purpuratus]|uniref:Uncharacterized protein n=1 Tax=Strongylocentrotus purpuratus TaxID=7668 RepID=A0A7M7PBG5_STRPU|nr:uncharacterized protein LOC588727 [Strongylocentrotus purpuratus]